ncbi:MAG: PAS domain S-box protein [Desulfobacterales bacterium]|nr:PAS domain S-box protein [Desulfobacterales bacterium]
MPLGNKFWKMAEHFMEVIHSETGFPVLVYDEKGIIVRATDRGRIGDLHAGAEKIMQGLADDYAVSPEEAERNLLVREGFSCPIVVGGKRVAAFGITGKLSQTKPLAKVAVRLIHSWIEDKAHQEQLERSERKYRSIFDHSAQGIFQTTLDGRILTANKALARMYGYPSPEVLLAELTDVTRQLYVDPEDRHRLLAKLQDRGQVTGFSTRLRRRDGKIIDAVINAHFVPDPESGERLVEGLVEDITARKKAERALKLSEEKYFKAFNNSPLMVVLSVLRTGRYIEVNETFERVMGYSREDVIGRTSLEIGSWMDPDDRERIQVAIESDGFIRGHEVKRRTKSGRILTVLFSAETIEVAGEACMVSVSLDISERKQAEEKLRLSENNLRITLDSIGDGVIVTDNDGVITRMNPTAEKLTGWPAAEALGRPLPEVFNIIHARTLKPMTDRAEAVMARGAQAARAGHVVLVSRDGGEYQIADNAAPIRGGDGRIVGVVLVFRDVTAAWVQEQKIREHESVLKHITANIPGMVYQFYATPRHEYGLRYISAKAEAIFGLEASAESFFEAFVQRLPAEEKEGFLDSIRSAVEALSPWHYEGRFIKPTGETIWFLGKAIPYREGDLVIADGVISDITESKTAQEEIRQRRQFLELVLSHAPDAIITTDAAHRVIDWNPGAVQMFGYTPAEARGQELDGLVAHGAQEGEAHRKTRRVLSGRRVERFETVRFHKDGTPRHVIASGAPIMESEALRGVVVVYTDITARKQAEAGLRASHERFLTVLESIDATIYVADMETFEILYMNDKMKQVFGGDFTGQKCYEVFRNEPQQCAVCTNDQLIDADGNPTEGCTWENENPVVQRWYVNYDRAIQWVDGRIVRLQVATDITKQKKTETERKDYEVQIQQVQKMEAIGVLAGGIAHDFNNILSAVIGFAELALIDTPAEDPVHDNLQQIHAAGLRARDLVQQILTFSRQDEKELKPLQIGSQVKEALKMLRSSLPTTIEMQVDIASRLGNVMADPTQIHQIVMNLCTNAAQEMEAQGGRLGIRLDQITLDAEAARLRPGLQAGNYVRLRVEDTGAGIPADIQDRIFTPYFTTKKKDKGTGLGLAVVHGIVQSFGGDIQVMSEVGHGTAFDILLPVIQAAAEAPPQQVALPMGFERILLVDDEAFIVEFGRQGLERLGYRVEGCTSSLDALERFRQAPERYDLVISDMTMPKMTGDQLAREIFKLRKGMPVILCTGYSARIDGPQAEKMGIRALLMKPLNMADLALNIRRVLDQAKGRK